MPLYHIFADESRQSNCPYVIFGFTLIPDGKGLLSYEQDIHNLKNRLHWQYELKWNKISPSCISIYKSFIDLFFSNNQAEFHCLAVSKVIMNDPEYSGRDKEAALYRGYEKAISGILSTKHRYRITLDRRSNKKANRANELRNNINGVWSHLFPDNQNVIHGLIRDIREVDSHDSQILQINDILTGAVGYAIEGCGNLAGASLAKQELVQHICHHLGCISLDNHSGHGSRFTIEKLIDDRDRKG